MCVVLSPLGGCVKPASGESTQDMSEPFDVQMCQEMTAMLRKGSGFDMFVDMSFARYAI